MTDDEAIQIITAHKEGKQIQINRRRQSNWQDGTWYDVTNPRWNFDECDYRVKPEPRKPREWWLIVDEPLYDTPRFVAYESRQIGCETSNQIHVREVIE